jgi:hypothetical protein
MDRILVNGLIVNIRMYPSRNSFRLMTGETEEYKVEITKAVYKVCQVEIDPSVLVAHDQAMEIRPAIYPFWKSYFRTYGIPSGSESYSCEEILNGLVPSRIVVAFVSSSAFTGTYNKNPYNFQNFNLNYLELTVNGQSVPSRPFMPSFTENDYVTEFLSMFFNKYPQHGGNFISLEDYPNGYCLFVFSPDRQADEKVMSKKQQGQTRLNMRFQSALSEAVTMITYSVVPSEFKIDRARNVLME